MVRRRKTKQKKGRGFNPLAHIKKKGYLVQNVQAHRPRPGDDADGAVGGVQDQGAAGLQGAGLGQGGGGCGGGRGRGGRGGRRRGQGGVGVAGRVGGAQGAAEVGWGGGGGEGGLEGRGRERVGGGGENCWAGTKFFLFLFGSAARRVGRGGRLCRLLTGEPLTGIVSSGRRRAGRPPRPPPPGRRARALPARCGICASTRAPPTLPFSLWRTHPSAGRPPPPGRGRAVFRAWATTTWRMA